MKLLVRNSLSYCVKKNKPCIGWVEVYFKDCLCNLRDELSFGFGLVSLVCWGFAEIPQIITNFRTKSSHGVSLLFLLTWIAGCWKGQHKEAFQEVDEVKKPLKSPKAQDSAIPIPKRNPRATARRDVYYYTSARSLAGSTTPPIRSYLWPVRSGPSAMGLEDDSLSDDETGEISKKHVSQPKPIARSAGYGAFLATTISMPQQTKALMLVYGGFTTRKLLQERDSENVYGQWLGWMMTAIYMGGRLPQIWLNIKRGSVEGLNPLMFIFALLANATYLASILVRSTAWSKIKANMPWLLDAAGCVVLDLFIILQSAYYKNFHKKTSRGGEDYGDYVEANNED
ncbi:unnamed protein product [Fraxinus pennsylvanica]|uniref:PQ-loop repeat family protein / transmembrane family protein n=1 Tax=Fraxinus pennsylvanica TaxID=56036 RepID=A0AAD1ZA51_9LAMI|nr:unnamed protein product [Fraxinus pennsylvanica]